VLVVVRREEPVGGSWRGVRGRALTASALSVLAAGGSLHAVGMSLLSPLVYLPLLLPAHTSTLVHTFTPTTHSNPLFHPFQPFPEHPSASPPETPLVLMLAALFVPMPTPGVP
jgi:hypothetical protein